MVITSGSMALSRSQETISVGNTRGGSGFMAVAGGHLRWKFFCMGSSLDTASPCRSKRSGVKDHGRRVTYLLDKPVDPIQNVWFSVHMIYFRLLTDMFGVILVVEDFA